MYIVLVIAIYSDKIRDQRKVFAEPVLWTGAEVCGKKIGISRSKYVRYAIINQLIRDGFPLNKLSSKFNAFYGAIATYE